MLPETADVALRIREAKIDEIKNLLKNTQFTSAVGHSSTADLLSKMVQVEIPVNRINLKLAESDMLIVFQVLVRLEEGRVLSEAELSQLPTKFFLVELLPPETLEALYHW